MYLYQYVCIPYRPLNATNDDDKALSDLSVGEGPIGLVVPLYPPPCVVCVCTRVCVCVCVCVRNTI